MNRLLILAIIIAFSCKHSSTSSGSIEQLDPALDSIISPKARIEVIATGFEWSEGPLWLEDQQKLIFSDVPTNTIYEWTEKDGKKLYLKPSGYTSDIPRGGEMGSNGLALNNEGKLILSQHGNRQIAMMNANLNDPKPVFLSLASNYQGKRFNSPNDVICRSNGDLFFTDPPYGLLKNMDDSSKETPFQGVYKVSSTGEVKLLVDTLTRPNGIALMPGEKTLIVANSDGEKKYWYAFDIDANDSLINPRIFASAMNAADGLKGSPDGMKIDRRGNVFASAPGGVWIFNKEGKLLGKINLPEAVSNCALSKDEKTLYVTQDMSVLRIKLRDF